MTKKTLINAPTWVKFNAEVVHQPREQRRQQQMEEVRRAVSERHHTDNARVAARGWILQESKHERFRDILKIDSGYYPGWECLVYDIGTITI